jgi:hypothetical protein
MRNRPSFALFALLAVGAAACSEPPTSPSAAASPGQALSVRLETANLVFHYSPGDLVDVARAEAFHDWAVAFLNVACPKKVDYYKFKDRAQQYELTRQAVTGWALPAPQFEVWTYLPFMNHEQFHLYSILLGSPTTFFVEGIAVAYQVDPLAGDYEAREKSGERVHDVARGYRQGGRLLPIAQIVTSSGWGTGDFTVTYVEGGSFVRYLADVHGIEKMKQVFRTVGGGDPLAVVSSKFQGIFGISLTEAEQRWLAFLDRGAPAAAPAATGI